MATLRGDLSTICDWPIKQNRYIIKVGTNVDRKWALRTQ